MVNPDGQVFPCCYLSNNYYQSRIFEEQGKYDELPDGHKANIEHPVMDYYKKHEEEMNIFSEDLEDILNHDWFTKILPNSWKCEGMVHFQCRRMCGVNEDV